MGARKRYPLGVWGDNEAVMVVAGLLVLGLRGNAGAFGRRGRGLAFFRVAVGVSSLAGGTLTAITWPATTVAGLLGA